MVIQRNIKLVKSKKKMMRMIFIEKTSAESHMQLTVELSL